MNTPLSSLAIAGGTPVRRGPLGPWPHFDAEQVDAVADVLRSGKVNYWTGDECRAFERESAAYFGAPHAIALTNGTVSLELLLHAWDIGPGDEVITTPRTFVGTATAIVARGAKPVFVDVDRDSQLITAETIASAITPRTRAILPVHLAGWVAEMDDIMALARKHDLVVFEDCAQCHGARYRGRHAGTIGDAGSWSFCQDKIMTTGGEGGLVTMHDEARWRKAWAYKDHGKSWAAVYEKPHPPGFRWLVESFGTNWRMTEMQGALGRIQLRRLDDWVATRTAHAERLIDHLRDTPGIRIPLPPSHIQHAWYKFYLFVEPSQLAPGWTRDRIQEAIHAEGVPCMAGSCSEIYLEQAFPDELRPAERLPVARELGETSLMLLVHPTLTLQDMDAFAESVNKVLNVATTTPWTA
jgi:dTDP-4-amino-4,6-dideoxygalactose transaminase